MAEARSFCGVEHGGRQETLNVSCSTEFKAHHLSALPEQAADPHLALFPPTSSQLLFQAILYTTARMVFV